MTAFLAQPPVFLTLLALATLGLILFFTLLIDTPEGSHARPHRRPLAALAHARPRIPHLRHQPVLSLPPRLVSRLRAAARHFPAGRDAGPLTAEDAGTYEWAAALHHRRQLGPAAPARYPRHLANAWVPVAAIIRAAPIGMLPWLQAGYGFSDDTGSFTAIAKGER